MTDEFTGQSVDGVQGVIAKYKIVFVGDAFVGKTCLINRFINDTFGISYQVFPLSHLSLLSVLTSFRKQCI